MTIDEAVLPGTPAFVVEAYASLAERAKTREFGLLEEDVIILDTETTGLSAQENELIEISAARLSRGQVAERFDTFVKPHALIPPEITQLTHITNADVAHAPSAREAVADLVEFVQGRPVVAHNATFDRTFIESVRGGVNVSDIWIDSLALSRIALPRLASHKLSFIAEVFGCSSVSHRANDDVDALAGVWHILLTALSDLPAGLAARLADMHPDVPWSYRPIFSYLAQETPGAIFSLAAARTEVVNADQAPDKVDADDLPRLDLPRADEVEAAFAPGGLVNRMYPCYEPRAEQIEMAVEVRDALATSTHRVIEAGTGVGKSIAYLVPLAQAAKRNHITVGVATKSNNLADQLMFHELPRLARELDGGLSYCALKGYDHYPCLRKLERMSRSATEIRTTRDPADTLTAVAVIYAYVCQSPDGDLDSLGIRWRSVNRQDLTTGSRECARRLCPFFPDRCLVHGARRRAARADVVVTNHSLLFRNVAADGKILPPIRHWVVDEAHAVEREARRQWAITVSADESRTVFERLGSERSGALGQITRDLAGSDAATLYMGLTAKAVAAVNRASIAMAGVFDGIRELAGAARSGGYDLTNTWVGPEVRESEAWQRFCVPAQVALDALEQADRSLVSLIEAVGQERPDAAADVADGERRLKELADGLKLVVEGEDDRYVYSFQVNRRLKAGGEALTAERLDIGEALAEQWLPEVKSAIFTSATISISGSFDHFNHAIGLDRLPKGTSRTLHLDSSYDFDSNMAVVVAGDLPDPRSRDAYLSALEHLLVDVHRAMGGSTLTLFTNRRDMEDLYERVEPVLAADGLELNCQLRGSSPKRLRDRFLSERSSSLFALKAFWEGFDASGETLRCVVIPKLPFASPTDPLSCERNLREDRAWARYALPEAVLEVKQAAGRLIRSSSDTGVLVLADSRLVSKGYGKKFLTSLPVSSYQRIDAAQVGHYLELWRRSHERGRH
ncbi:helicase C-terminal domain-containing protein [Collinsella sp. An2]|uniref:helicase C-terminal domain-containing protein n=1 Tax=Collinsella sp. An2 TaxID=1965585 RepID=UPI000B37C11A|nr:helicase C-terminal domain-containing protein [Collinsella sp. An2]OUP10440.1 DNA polymerase III subunit epsilon [Collinsella sp. An2]